MFKEAHWFDLRTFINNGDDQATQFKSKVEIIKQSGNDIP